MSKCVGCGVTLQNTSPNDLGFVSKDDFSLCERCFRIKHYNENRKVTNIRCNDIIDRITDDDYVIYVSNSLNDSFVV